MMDKLDVVHPHNGIFSLKKEVNSGNSLAVLWLGLSPVTAKRPGSIPGWGTKIPQAVVLPKKRKREF